MSYLLGKKPAVYNPKALRFGDYPKTTALPYIPSSYQWGTGVPRWPMYGNDTMGDCTIAAAAHHAGVWTFRESRNELIFPEAEIVSAYSAVGGYVPGDTSTDNGAVMVDVLRYWIKTGIGKDKLLAYSTMEPGNNLEVQASIYLLGGCYIGLALPNTAYLQTEHNGRWSLVPGYQTNPDAAPGSWGGHCVPLIGYSQKALCTITWGMPMYMTWGFYRAYADEAYAPLSRSWVASGNVAPNHFDLAQLEADLKAL